MLNKEPNEHIPLNVFKFHLCISTNYPLAKKLIIGSDFTFLHLPISVMPTSANDEDSVIAWCISLSKSVFKVGFRVANCKWGMIFMLSSSECPSLKHWNHCLTPKQKSCFLLQAKRGRNERQHGECWCLSSFPSSPVISQSCSWPLIAGRWHKYAQLQLGNSLPWYLSIASGWVLHILGL